VMDKELAKSPYLAGDFSIADMASYPWTAIWERQQQKIEDFPNVKRWLDTMANRAGVKAAYEKAKAYQSTRSNTDPEVAKILFGQSAATVRRPG
jgi:GST-like protein